MAEELRYAPRVNFNRWEAVTTRASVRTPSSQAQITGKKPKHPVFSCMKPLILEFHRWSIDGLCQRLVNANARSEIGFVRRSGRFVVDEFKDKMRKDGKYFFTHFLGVAEILIDAGVCSTRTLAAALLHDYIEDILKTSTATEAQVNAMVKVLAPSELPIDVATAREIIKIVHAVTKLRFGDHSKEETIARLLEVSKDDIRPLLLKLADRLYNQEDYKGVQPDVRERKSIETRDIYAPLAEKLGMWEWRCRLYDTVLRDLEPELHKRLNAERETMLKTRSAEIEAITAALKLSLGESDFEIVSTPSCLWDIKRNSIARGDAEVRVDASDLQSFSIVLHGKDPIELYRAFGRISADFKIVPGTYEDALNSPRASGYRAILGHFETPHGKTKLQILTKEMFDQVTSGVALTCGKDRNWFKTGTGLVQEIITLAGELGISVSSAHELMKQVAQTINVKTPAGRWITVPKIGEKPPTILDYAERVLSDFPARVIAATVNGKYQPLWAPLKAGTVIDLIFSPDKAIKYDPFRNDMASNPKTKKAIREAYATLPRNTIVEGGRAIMAKALEPLLLKTADLSLPVFRAFIRFLWRSILTNMQKELIFKSRFGDNWRENFVGSVSPNYNEFSEDKGITIGEKAEHTNIEDLYYLLGIYELSPQKALAEFRTYYEPRARKRLARLKKNGEITTQKYIISGINQPGVISDLSSPFKQLDINIFAATTTTKREGGQKKYKTVFTLPAHTDIVRLQISRLLQAISELPFVQSIQRRATNGKLEDAVPK